MSLLDDWSELTDEEKRGRRWKRKSFVIAGKSSLFFKLTAMDPASTNYDFLFLFHLLLNSHRTSLSRQLVLMCVREAMRSKKEKIEKKKVLKKFLIETLKLLLALESQLIG